MRKVVFEATVETTWGVKICDTFLHISLAIRIHSTAAYLTAETVWATNNFEVLVAGAWLLKRSLRKPLVKQCFDAKPLGAAAGICCER